MQTPQGRHRCQGVGQACSAQFSCTGRKPPPCVPSPSCLWPTAARSPSACSARPTNSASAPSRSTPTRIASPSIASRQTNRIWWAAPANRSAPTSTSNRSWPWRRRTASMPSTPATASSRKTPISLPPAALPGSSLSGRASNCCAPSATKPLPAASPRKRACRSWPAARSRWPVSPMPFRSPRISAGR